MLDDYLNKEAEIFFSRLSEVERAWTQTVIEELRRRFPMADHWTTGGQDLQYIDIRIGRKLKGKMKGRPAMYLRDDGPVAMRINKRALEDGISRVLSSKEAPELADIQVWLEENKLNEAGNKRTEGAGLKPADYDAADGAPEVEGPEEDDNDAQSAISLPELPLNLILYGPPGAGKTHSTVCEALKIIENTAIPEGEYSAQKKRFDTLRGEGRIAFVTFHQSFSYEDFIEGIRADVSGGQLSYKVHDGIFKRMAITAMYTPARKTEARTGIAFDDLYDEFLTEVAAALPYSIKAALGGNLEIREINDNGTLKITHPGRSRLHSVSRRRLKALYEAYSTTAELEKKNSSAAIKDVIGGANFTAHWGALKSLLIFKERVGAELLKELDDLSSVNEEIDYEQMKRRVFDSDQLGPNGKPYVLIIDEINRANMSRVFGELITLIEPSKRAGKTEAVEVQLPYSNDRFSVPYNLYVIGTMNTADRSLAVVDTALRRRFSFVEMMPDPTLLKRQEIEGVDLVRMLQTINLRIEGLYDREHTIGHSFFMDLDEDSTIAHVSRIFRNNVLPLLEEYFFEDWEKIVKILGNSGIYELQETSSLGLADTGKRYRRNLEKLQYPATYKAIYGSANG